MLEQIDHVNIVVDNLEAMTRFYRDRLGFKVTKQVTISGAWIDQVVGLNGVEADVVYLDPSSGPRVELIKYRSPAGQLHEDLPEPNTRGLRHLAFRVDNIDSTSMGLRRSGIEMISEVQDVPSDQVTYAGGVRKRLCYFRDPEGNLLELCEYRGAQASTAGADAPKASAAAASTASASTSERTEAYPSARQRRRSAARRRLYLSMTLLLLLGAVGVAAYFKLVKPHLHLIFAPPPSTQAAPAFIDWADPYNTDVMRLQRQYAASEGTTNRGEAFERLGGAVYYVQLCGGHLGPEQIIEKLGPPDLYRDLGPFRYYTYIFSKDKQKNNAYVDITFDREPKATTFEWGKLADGNHSAASWKKFPTTQGVTDPKALVEMLPPILSP
jgi:catechol 2,3-dioxygenase-like lactoylglutathione lyase family enzyme